MSTLTQAAGTPLYRRQTPTLLQVVGSALWRALEDVGRRRAAAELTLLAGRHEPFDPELARTLRHAAAHGMTDERGGR
jgi:hypothetical protein